MRAGTANLQNIKGNTQAVGRDKVVRLRFRIVDGSSGDLLQYGDDLFYLHGGYGGAFPKVERAMEGCRVGDRVEVMLSPEEGYGPHRPELVLELPSAGFEGDVPEAGSAVDGELPDGQSVIFTVSAVSGDLVKLDANHPFAGKQLAFDFEVLEIRESTDAERAAGFAFDGMFC
ncbi:MAG TPA: peptidylprolyl isomerase [Gammaproteobacteria bacterium]|nr:peptidylprolyl isomerase [Gammaproteobacteria bacterium]